MKIESATKRIVVDYRDIDSDLMFQLGKVTHVQANGSIEEHVHPREMEITYFIKGEQVYTVGGENYPISSGEVFVTFPNEKHSSGGHPKDKSQIFYMIIDLNLLEKICFDWQEAERLREQLYHLDKRVFKGKENFGGLLETLLSYGLYPGEFSKTQIRNLCLTYLIEVLVCAKSEENIPAYTMIQVTDYIEEHLTHQLNIKLLAELMGISEGRFKTNFRKERGIPPQEYILRQKVKKAKELLETTDQSITEIGFGLGFSTSQYFSTVFKRFTAYTPSEYRKIY